MGLTSQLRRAATLVPMNSESFTSTSIITSKNKNLIYSRYTEILLNYNNSRLKEVKLELIF